MLRYLSAEQLATVAKNRLKVTNVLSTASGYNELSGQRRTGHHIFHLVLPPSRKNTIPLIQVSVNEYSSYVLSAKGIVYVYTSRHHFHPVEIPEKIVKVYKQLGYTFILSSTGKVWELSDILVPIVFDEPIASIFSYTDQCVGIYFLTVTGKVFYLRAEPNTIESHRRLPVRLGWILNTVKIISISTTPSHNLFLSDKGVVYSYDDTPRLVAVPEPITKIVASKSVVLLISAKGTVYKVARKNYTLVAIELETVNGTVVDACTVETCTILLMSDGSVHLSLLANSFRRIPLLICSKIISSEQCIMMLSTSGKLFALGDYRSDERIHSPKLIELDDPVTDIEASIENCEIVIEINGKLRHSTGSNCRHKFGYQGQW